jgi:chemotaxis protein CheD
MPRHSLDPRFNTRIITVAAGQFAIASGEGAVLSAVLGCCVAICLRDRGLGLGGMSHFLLPGDENAGTTGLTAGDMHIGAAAMEVLIGGLVREGASRKRLEAKIFGGARLLAGSKDVGSGERNVIFARRFLNREGVPITGEDLGGNRPRRISYEPISGRALVHYFYRTASAGIAFNERQYRQTMAISGPA